MPIGVNIPKAKELQKERFRQVRKPLLEALDIDYQRADEAGDASKKTEIATKKQALRDAPADSGITSAADTDALKAQWKTDILGTSPYS